MDEHVVFILKVIIILFYAKTAKAKFIKIDTEWSVICYQHINTQVKLFAANQQWILKVFANDITFFVSLVF